MAIGRLRADTTICLYGDSGDGKTSQLGELADHLYRETGLKTRLANADLGGSKGIAPLIKRGVIEEVPLTGDPWIWLNHVVRGDTPDPTTGRWTPRGERDGIGMYAFESIAALGEVFIEDLRARAARDENIGGGGSYSVTAREGSEVLKIGANNQTHYNVAQQQLYEAITRSQSLPCQILLWTTACERATDEAKASIVGPAVAGKAMTAKVPRWFQYTFRVAAITKPGALTVHRLYLDSYVDPTTGGARGLANARVPAGGAGVKVPATIEPASIVKALDLLKARHDAALKEIA